MVGTYKDVHLPGLDTTVLPFQMDSVSTTPAHIGGKAQGETQHSVSSVGAVSQQLNRDIPKQSPKHNGSVYDASDTNAHAMSNPSDCECSIHLPIDESIQVCKCSGKKLSN